MLAQARCDLHRPLTTPFDLSRTVTFDVPAVTVVVRGVAR